MFFIWVTLIVFAVFLFRLNSKLNNLQKSINELKGANISDLNVSKFKDTNLKSFEKKRVKFNKGILNKFILWLKEDWLMKLGILLLLFGVVWAVKYAFLNNLIGPLGRIVFGMFLGISFLLLGWKRIRLNPAQGELIFSLGAVIETITFVAAYNIYGFFNLFLVFLFLILNSYLVGFLSVVRSSSVLAIFSIILGFLSLFFFLNESSLLSVYLYIFSLLFLSSLVVLKRGFAGVVLISLFFTFIFTLITSYKVNFISNASFLDSKVLFLLFSYLFVVLFFTLSFRSISSSNNKISKNPDLITPLLNGVYFYGATLIYLKDDLHFLAFGLFAVFLAIASYLLFIFTKKVTPFYLNIGVAFGFLLLNTFEVFKGSSNLLFVFLAFEIGAFIFLMSKLTSNSKTIGALLSLFILPIFLSFDVLNVTRWDIRGSFLNSDFFSLLIFIAILFFLSFYLLRFDNFKKIAGILFLLGVFYFAWLVWLFWIGGLKNNDIAIMLILSTYTLFAIFFYFYGYFKHSRYFLILGIFFIGFVVLRLFFVEMWKMELTERVFTFLIIGIILFSTAFFSRKKLASN